MSGECDVCGESCVDCICEVSHPRYYRGMKGIEAIDVIESFGLNFCLGNAIKYILRAGKKGETEEDLKKAVWYLKRELSTVYREVHG